MTIAQRFLQFADLLPDSLMLLKSDGTILACNRSAADQLGLASGQPSVRKLADLLTGQEDSFSQYLHACTRTRQMLPGSLRLRHADGEFLHCRCEGGLYQPRSQAADPLILLRVSRRDPARKSFVMLNQRIAQLDRESHRQKRAAIAQRKLERQLQHAQKLESLGVLAGGIAHDFNNLLTSILGYTELALEELPGTSTARPFLIEAMNGAQRAAELTKQMLAYSGKGQFVVEPLDLSRVIEDIRRLLEISISKKCVMQFTFMPELPAIKADATQLRQILMNLVINASEAIGDCSGEIAVTTGVMYCDHSYLSETWLDENLREGRYVYVEVADTGCGMSEETRSKIFDPFFTTKFTGRGLGLSAVLGIVRGHQGAIKVHSEERRGTSFKILFPATDQPAQPEGRRGRLEGSAWRGSGAVLVVDDEEAVRVVARHMLATMGFTVVTAGDGQEAIEVYRGEGETIRLVLLDMTMPRLGGAETFRELRRIRDDVLVILSSGYNEQTARSQFTGQEPAAFLPKPYHFEELLEVVRKVLEPQRGERGQS